MLQRFLTFMLISAALLQSAGFLSLNAYFDGLHIHSAGASVLSPEAFAWGTQYVDQDDFLSKITGFCVVFSVLVFFLKLSRPSATLVVGEKRPTRKIWLHNLKRGFMLLDVANSIRDVYPLVIASAVAIGYVRVISMAPIYGLEQAKRQITTGARAPVAQGFSEHIALPKANDSLLGIKFIKIEANKRLALAWSDDRRLYLSSISSSASTSAQDVLILDRSRVPSMLTYREPIKGWSKKNTNDSQPYFSQLLIPLLVVVLSIEVLFVLGCIVRALRTRPFASATISTGASRNVDTFNFTAAEVTFLERAIVCSRDIVVCEVGAHETRKYRFPATAFEKGFKISQPNMKQGDQRTNKVSRIS